MSGVLTKVVAAAVVFGVAYLVYRRYKQQIKDRFKSIFSPKDSKKESSDRGHTTRTQRSVHTEYGTVDAPLSTRHRRGETESRAPKRGDTDANEPVQHE